jgi:hypothetical protein
LDVLLPVLDQQSPELLYSIEEFFSRLLYQHPAQQDTQRTHISAKRGLFRAIIRARDQLSQAVFLVSGIPQGLALTHRLPWYRSRLPCGP